MSASKYLPKDCTYDGKFEDNILVIGQTECGKTTFIQKLAKNKLFGKLNEIFWISKISPIKEKKTYRLIFNSV